MSFSNQKFYLPQYKNFYKNIGNVKCHYFNNALIFFNKNGFNHLIRTGNSQRSIFDQRRRLRLIKYCPEILMGRYISVKSRIILKGSKTFYYWSFKAHVDDIYMKLIVRQVDKGPKQFFSIFPIKH